MNTYAHKMDKREYKRLLRSRHVPCDVRNPATIYDMAPTLGGRIRLLRILRCMSQNDLAVESDVSQACVDRIEADLVEPRMASVLSIANALNVGLEYLVGVQK